MKICRLLLCFLFLVFSYSVNAYDKVKIYVVAHPDDWQLFMGIEAYNDIQDSNNKVIFIITTSGDATYNKAVVNAAFANAREAGVLNSVRFCSDMKTEIDSSCKTKTYAANNHELIYYAYKNVKTFFLRIPDGCLKAGYKGQSLEYFSKGQINSISTIDNTETYDSWGDFVQTLRSVFEKETENIADVSLSFQDSEEQFNPNDHPDHVYSGKAAIEAAASFPYMERIAFVDYNVSSRAINLSPESIAIKAGIFAIADFGITEHKQKTSFDKTHLNYLMRSYSRNLGPLVINPYKLFHLFLAPNPATEITNFSFFLEDPEPVSISVTDLFGNIIWQKEKFTAYRGKNSISIPLEGFTSGTFLIRLEKPSGIFSTKLVKL